MTDNVFNWLRVCLVMLASVDWLLSLVLVRMHLGKGKPDLLDWTCSGVFTCRSVLNSRYATLHFLSPWPLPVAAGGLAHFTVVALWLLAVGRLPDAWHQLWIVPALFGLVGLLGSLYFLYIMSTKLRAWCGLCLTIHGTHLLLVPGLWILWLAGGSHGSTLPAPWQVPLFALLVGAAIGLAEIRYVQAVDAAKQADKALRKLDRTLTEQFDLTMPLQIPVGPADPIDGPPDARHTVVIFEDFQCSTCAEVNEALCHVLERLPESFRFVHKDFPLNAACNPSRRDLNVRDHEYACQAAAAAEAAWRLGGQHAFVRMRNLLFENQSLLPRQPYEAFARLIGLDASTFNNLRTSPDVLREIQKDACVGAGLGVRSTPAVFVDGRRLMNPVIHRAGRILLDETFEHWQHVLRTVSFGAEELGFRGRL